MDMQKRQRIGMLGSVLVHCLVFLIVAFTGVLTVSHASQDDIVEVTMFGGGGGGGGQGDGANGDVVEEEAGPQGSEAEETPPTTDEIIQNDKKETPPAPKPQAGKPKAYAKKGEGSGGGQGTGHGTGTGSGTGPGSGSGSGGGIGSGHGTGIGSGYGAGTSIYASPAIPPRLVRNTPPSYPTAEKNAGIQGTANLHLLVGKDGSVEEVTILSSSGNANLDQAAVNACYKWKFTSARNKAGQTVRCYMTVPITFRLR